MSTGNTTVVAQSAVRAELGLPPSGRIVLCRGGFGDPRPLDLLLKAIPYVLEAAPTSRFIVLGDGPRQEGPVTFTGPVSAAVSERHAVACDLGLYITQSVGGSLPSFSVDEIFDFLRAGRPIVVASDNPDAVCFAQVNNIGVASRLTGDETADLAALIKNLTHLLVDATARQRRAAQARELGKALHRTARGGMLDIVRATLRRAASL